MYRIWSKANNEYVDLHDYFVDGYGGVNITGTKISCINSFATLNFIIEQSTGIEDVNGDEIYIGDLVTRNKSDIYEVKYDKEVAQFILVEKEGYEYLITNEVKIIGNIHK
jgi:hypothetical protein